MTKDVCIYDQPNAKQVTSTISYAKAATDPLADERVGTYTYAVKNSSTAKTQNTFDNFKRVKKKVYTIAGKAYTKTLTYNKTRISKEADTAGITNTYTYDSLGRISKIVSDGKTTTYHYDLYGQLVREDNQALDATFVYVYNNIGNLTSIKKYAYTLASTSSPSGSYTTTSFGYTTDKLTSFGGTTIAYNTMGCPTTYDGKTATWSKGKLSKLSSGTRAEGISNYTYTYNALGQRVARNYAYLEGTLTSDPVQLGQLTGSDKTYYYDHAGRLISETVSKTYYGADSTSESIVFLYDESGIVGMVHTVGDTASTYYFHRNLLGDVVAIYDTSGNMVAKYLYDAFGNCTISSETTNTAVAAANPIRYRGYYYDSDTGLYYCNARYYSPKWRRFISPDDTAYLDPESVNGLNLYCYCNNDPVNKTDPNGHSFVSLLNSVNFVFSAIKAPVETAIYATIKDIYQIASGNVYAAHTLLNNKDNVQIRNSYTIITPWVKYGYAFYLNYFNNETKNAIDGTTEGMVFEWVIHNLGYVAFTILGNERRAIQAKDVDLGRTLFADDHGGLIEHSMKILYLLLCHKTAIRDLITNGGYNG